MMTIDRRHLLKSGLGAAGGLILPPHLPVWAQADRMTYQSAPQTFVDVGSAMTGIPAEVLDPPINSDDLRLADIYYTVCLKFQLSNAVDTMMDDYNRVISWESPKVFAEWVLSNIGFAGTPDTRCYARLVMMLWLFGAWYGNTEITHNGGSSRYISAHGQCDFVISGRTYVSGWIWRIAQAHPLGYSQFAFGSWASEPPSLADYHIPTS